MAPWLSDRIYPIPLGTNIYHSPTSRYRESLLIDTKTVTLPKSLVALIHNLELEMQNPTTGDPLNQRTEFLHTNPDL